MNSFLLEPPIIMDTLRTELKIFSFSRILGLGLGLGAKQDLLR